MAAQVQPQPFTCDVANDGGTAVLTLAGEFDLATAAALDVSVAEALTGGARSLVIDLARVRFVDSTGLHRLLVLAGDARRRGFALELIPGSDGVMRLFELTGTRTALPFRISP